MNTLPPGIKVGGNVRIREMVDGKIDVWSGKISKLAWDLDKLAMRIILVPNDLPDSTLASFAFRMFYWEKTNDFSLEVL